jgi:hypothetical protein
MVCSSFPSKSTPKCHAMCASAVAWQRSGMLITFQRCFILQIGRIMFNLKICKQECNKIWFMASWILSWRHWHRMSWLKQKTTTPQWSFQLIIVRMGNTSHSSTTASSQSTLKRRSLVLVVWNKLCSLMAYHSRLRVSLVWVIQINQEWCLRS